jgi:hypothetical protein
LSAVASSDGAIKCYLVCACTARSARDAITLSHRVLFK